MEVGGCRWLSSANVSLMVRPSFIFMNSAPNSASAADDATNLKMVYKVKITPLSVMGYPSLDSEPRKKWPDARLLALFADRYDASEWLFNTMSDA